MKIYFHPNKPLGHKINVIIDKLKIQLTSRERADLYFWWSYNSKMKELPTFLKDKRCINSKCICTLKTFVDERVFQFFGYRTLVNPETYDKAFVMKTDVNGLHYGVIYHTNVKPKKGFVYQQLFDTEKDKIFTDIRIPYIFGEIPFVFLKHKKIRFAIGTDEKIVKIEMKSFQEVFDYDWRVRFRKFCENYIDYAEIDVLHNRIIDVNNTPSAAMFKYMSEFQKSRYIKEVSEIFKSNL